MLVLCITIYVCIWATITTTTPHAKSFNNPLRMLNLVPLIRDGKNNIVRNNVEDDLKDFRLSKYNYNVC